MTSIDGVHLFTLALKGEVIREGGIHGAARCTLHTETNQQVNNTSFWTTNLSDKDTIVSK